MEKWIIQEGSLMKIPKTYGWILIISIDGKSGIENEVCEVFGKTKEQCLSRAKRICNCNEMEAALKSVKADHNILGKVTAESIKQVIFILEELKA